MRTLCKSYNRFGRNTGFFIAIYCSLFLSNSHPRTASHFTVIAGITAAVVMLLIALAACFACRKRWAA
jgi:Na+/melibiose symporter-like transporter